MFPNDTLARRGGTAARVYGNINDWAVIPPCAAVTIRVAFHVVLNSTGTSGGFRNPAIQGFILNALNTTFNVYNIHFIPNPASPNIDYINDDYYFHFPYGSVNFILSKPSGISW